MNAIAKTCLLTLFVGAAQLLVNPLAHAASDYKTLTGTACLPSGSASLTNFSWTSNGITNVATSDRYAICGLVIDSDIGPDNVGQMSVVVHYYNANTATKQGRCVVAAGSPLIYGSTTQTKTIDIPGNSSVELGFSDVNDVNGYAWLPTTANCRLPANTSITRIYYWEGTTTNTP